MTKRMIALLCILSLVTACSTSNRSFQKPNGQVKTYYEPSNRQARDYQILARAETNEYLFLGIASSWQLPELQETGYTEYKSYGADDPGFCFAMGILTFGLIWIMDSVMWLADGGSDDSMCFASLAKPRYDSWHKARATGDSIGVLDEPKSRSFALYYAGKQIGSQWARGGVVQISKATLPGPVALDKIKVEWSSIDKPRLILK